MDEVRRRKEKKVKKNQLDAFDEEMDQLYQEELELIPRPKLTDLWVYRFVIWSIKFVVFMPVNIKNAVTMYKEEKERVKREEHEAKMELQRQQEELAAMKGNLDTPYLMQDIYM